MAITISFLFLRRSCFELRGERCREGQALREWKLLKVTKAERAVKPAWAVVVAEFGQDLAPWRHPEGLQD
jgi:hypothetical protein